jgi:hypothetical protein
MQKIMEQRNLYTFRLCSISLGLAVRFEYRIHRTALLKNLLRPEGVKVRVCVDDQSNGVTVFWVWTFSDNSLDILTEGFSVNPEQSVSTAVIVLSRLSGCILFEQNVNQNIHQRIGGRLLLKCDGTR